MTPPIGWGATLMIVGLALDVIGVVPTLISAVRLTDEQIENAAKRMSASYYGEDTRLQQTILGRLIRERGLVRWGLVILASGFVLQAMGAYVSVRS